MPSTHFRRQRGRRRHCASHRRRSRPTAPRLTEVRARTVRTMGASMQHDRRYDAARPTSIHRPALPFSIRCWRHAARCCWPTLMQVNCLLGATDYLLTRDSEVSCKKRMHVTQVPNRVTRASRVPFLQPPSRKLLMQRAGKAAATDVFHMPDALSLACTGTMRPLEQAKVLLTMVKWQRCCCKICL